MHPILMQRSKPGQVDILKCSSPLTQKGVLGTNSPIAFFSIYTNLQLVEINLMKTSKINLRQNNEKKSMTSPQTHTSKNPRNKMQEITKP